MAMERLSLRLECLKLAVAHGSTLDRFDPVAKAEAYFQFVVAETKAADETVRPAKRRA